MTPIHAKTTAKTNANIVIFQLQWYILNCIYFLGVIMLAKVFKSGNSQAVRLPKAMRFDVNEVDITKDGDNLILKPVRPNLADAFYALGELHDAFKDFERDDTPPIERESFDE
ncbi:hypothetical protein BSPWISOXPB_10491 [uncultured Gammaproteobacteria bacterium]|jgi:antitoxin VapB|nr:hypothetical protein BSPWISOXPB_1697 [uncultured Gammaproteobacteria bacterium]VVM27519.1 hypothetical protein BSPWISOXPB_10491 [uncultured Gammaproteobacteria bacterium]